MVESFGNNIIGAFTGGTSVNAIYSYGVKVWEKQSPIPDNEIHYTSSDGNVVTPDSRSSFGANIVSNTYNDGLGVITFDGTVTKIGDWAFQNSLLTSITFPTSVTELGVLAFDGCDGLTSPPLTNNITSVKRYCFSFCNGFSSTTLPTSLTIIPNGMFYDGTIRIVNIPSTVTEIGAMAFANHRSLTVIMGSTVPPTMIIDSSTSSYNTFNNNLDLLIKVPAVSLQAYKTATGWSDYASSIVSQ